MAKDIKGAVLEEPRGEHLKKALQKGIHIERRRRESSTSTSNNRIHQNRRRRRLM
jgi:hypothetical protein